MTLYPFIRHLPDPDAPAFPVSVDEAKSFLRISHDRENIEIHQMVQAATYALKTALGRDLLSTGWRMMVDRFPRGGAPIHITRAPVLSVEEIAYFTPDGERIALEPDDDFTVTRLNDMDGAYLFPKLGASWPAVIARDTIVAVDFTSGFAAVPAELPAPFRQAILAYVTHCYENRSAAGFSSAEWDAAVRDHKVWVA